MNSQTKAAQFSKMLEDCKHHDKDIRQQAAFDLMTQMVNSDQQLEETLEKRICDAFVSHLDDKHHGEKYSSKEVKSNAVSCIQKIASKIRDTNLIRIVKKLGEEIAKGQDVQTIDIFSLTTKSIISEAGEGQAAALISTL